MTDEQEDKKTEEQKGYAPWFEMPWPHTPESFWHDPEARTWEDVANGR